MTDAERLKLLAKSPKRSTRSPAQGRPLERPTDVDGLPMFDHHRAPDLFKQRRDDNL